MRELLAALERAPLLDFAPIAFPRNRWLVDAGPFAGVKPFVHFTQPLERPRIQDLWFGDHALLRLVKRSVPHWDSVCLLGCTRVASELQRGLLLVVARLRIPRQQGARVAVLKESVRVPDDFHAA